MKMDVNIAIIGAGQAGLAMAYYLNKQIEAKTILSTMSEPIGVK